MAVTEESLDIVSLIYADAITTLRDLSVEQIRSLFSDEIEKEVLKEYFMLKFFIMVLRLDSMKKEKEDNESMELLVSKTLIKTTEMINKYTYIKSSVEEISDRCSKYADSMSAVDSSWLEKEFIRGLQSKFPKESLNKKELCKITQSAFKFMIPIVENPYNSQVFQGFLKSTKNNVKKNNGCLSNILVLFILIILLVF